MSSDIATCMYYTGIDPMTGEEVFITKALKDRRLQRALLQFFKPENYFEVRKALLDAGRGDLIGNSCNALIPAQAPMEALKARQKQANNQLKQDHYHTIPNQGKNSPSKGYRPNRNSASRRNKNNRSHYQA